MKPTKFTGSTTRAALAKVREALGDDAVILSNRSTPGGVEVVAVAEREFDSLVAEPAPVREQRPAQAAPRPGIAEQIAAQIKGLRPASASAEPLLASAAPVAPVRASTDRDRQGGSTFPWDEQKQPRQFSFIDFVRGRKSRTDAAAIPVDHVLRSDVKVRTGADSGNGAPPREGPALFERVAGLASDGTSRQSRGSLGSRGVPEASVRTVGAVTQSASDAPAAAVRADRATAPQPGAKPPAQSRAPARHAAVDAALQSTPQGASQTPFDERAILEELRSLRNLVHGQMATTTGSKGPAPVSEPMPNKVAPGARTASDPAIAAPAAVRSGALPATVLLQELLAAGFAGHVADQALTGLPSGSGIDRTREWAESHLASLLACGSTIDDVIEQGGVFALTGPTGVGKTTTAAKLAARCAVRYGAASVGLITTDTYRIGAPDQLRIYGKILGVPVETVHDHEWLQRVLEGMSDRRLVLIDTIGMGQRDARIDRSLDLLDEFRIGRLLLIAAGSQTEVQDEIVSFYRGASAAGVVLTKIDEAVKLGPALSNLIDRRLVLRYLTNGQRVPEDLHIPDPANLVRTAMRADGRDRATRRPYPQPRGNAVAIV